MSGGDFLARWSRRKREAARPEPAPTVSRPETTAAPEAAATTELPAEDLSAEDLARLPALDALTAETDLTQFLREGVPAVLRNAALRRMWSLDPAIRDFVSEAREYAWDWNVPGDVPGSGPLLSGERVEEMVARILGEPGPEAPRHSERDNPDQTKKEPDELPDSQVQSARADAPGSVVLPEPTVLPLRNTSEIGEVRRPEPAETPQPGANPLRQRRHGGAIPI
ncbi:DUF3306 domain-containing protein [Methylobacterium oryzisoli]|uniref:DUF3306 domain-containing protein n=1 Tax=Methylobacterium oryzisoli TaxID=3385502 RepID=UPI003891B12C